MSIPMSLRTAAGEQSYQDSKTSGNTMPLELEPSLRQWKHWRLIDNRFPYTVAFKEHHMLVPKRGVADRWELSADEKAEFEVILKEYVYPTYDLWFENCPKRRSIRSFYHIHLASYHDNREQMEL
jgi:hypothetical protein